MFNNVCILIRTSNLAILGTFSKYMKSIKNIFGWGYFDCDSMFHGVVQKVQAGFMSCS